MTVAADRRAKLSDQAYDSLRSMIVSGRLAPGARIVEPEWADRLGISRTPVREALLQLAREGLVAIYPQSGSFVAPISLEEVREAQFIREHLECAVIRDVAARIDKRGISDLRSLVARQQDALADQDPQRFYLLDEEMHATFSRIAGRRGVWPLIQRSKAHLDRVRRLSLPMPNQIARLIRQHRAVVNAVAEGDADAAEAALRRHLREVFTTISALKLDRAQDPGAAPPLDAAG